MVEGAQQPGEYGENPEKKHDELLRPKFLPAQQPAREEFGVAPVEVRAENHRDNHVQDQKRPASRELRRAGYEKQRRQSDLVDQPKKDQPRQKMVCQWPFQFEQNSHMPQRKTSKTTSATSLRFVTQKSHNWRVFPGNILPPEKSMKFNFRLLRQLWVCCGIAILGLSPAPMRAAELNYLPDGKPNVVALLAPPPAAGSAEQAADLAEVEAVEHSAPSNDVALAFSQKEFSIFTFTPDIGPFFQPGKFPKTEAFFHRVQTDAETVTDKSKKYWRRPRPYVVDPSLAEGKLEKSFSYPSGHSTESMVLALVLADLFPEDRDAILAEARSIGWHRVEIGRHYPTDIYAGRVLAQAIVRQMEKNEDFQRDFAAAKSEIEAGQAVGKAN